jgi:hypothetical protein
MHTPSGSILVGTLLMMAVVSSDASAQTTSPRNLKSPTQQELMADCQSKNDAERRTCEERVRAGGMPGEGSRNKSVAQQKSEAPTIQNRAATDPGTSSVPPSTSNHSNTSADKAGAVDPTARSREGRIRTSQRSDDLKAAPQPRTESNPANSTGAVSTRSSDPSKRVGEESKTNAESDRRKTRAPDSSSERTTDDQPARDGAQSRPQNNPRTTGPTNDPGE